MWIDELYTKGESGMQERPLIRRHVWLVRLFFLTLGILLLIAGTALSLNPVLNPIVSGAGISLLAGTLSTTFQAWFGIDPPGVANLLEIKERLIDRGVDAVHLHRGSFDLKTRFPSLAEAHTIDMMFNSGRYMMATENVNIKNALEKHGCKIRLLLSDPDNPMFSFEEISQGLSLTAASIPHEISDTITGMQQVAKHVGHRGAAIEVRLASCIMTASMIFVDNKFLRLTPYVPYTHSANVPFYDIVAEKDDRLFDAYQSVFEDVWERSVQHSTVILPSPVPKP
jgi:hypothetical protein